MRYSHDSWSIELPSKWQVEETLDVISFFHPEGVGSFEVSTFFKDDGDITIDDIITFAEVDNPTRTNLPFLTGIEKMEIEEGEAVFHWWLATANQMIYATYVCDKGQENVEASERQTLISSLRSLFTGNDSDPE